MTQSIRDRSRIASRQTTFWTRFRRDQTGAGVIEYALIAGLISVVTMGAMVVLGEEQEQTYDCLSATIDMGEQSVICGQIGTIS